ncbi:nuclear transport factor 2 family protein [Kitasatospora purpeofusca]|uniref:nuclear transport factor 2 family protein n=1 Tax=Kitasatospora purpeofusca TaxID=67352 RepID=UPI002A59BC47|nr:nuclear transport factor 2 family protein [Kitasatospora purpeofusca]MDY0813641.1 nuclear transport factor 2 family protein [Kitasatospora purpeofusca]
MADFNGIAQAFVSHYFGSFDDYAARDHLASLYRPESMLTWEGSQSQGANGILDQLKKPELKVVKHRVTSVDSQPGANNSVVVLVTGSLVLDNAFDRPLQFTQAFTLAPIPGQSGGYFIYNQIFRLLLG